MSAIQSYPLRKERIPRTATQERAPRLSPRLPIREFEVHPWLSNPHLMTMLAEYWPRNFSALPRATERLFEVEDGTRLLAKCHWHPTPRRHPTLVLVHGLEGSHAKYIS